MAKTVRIDRDLYIVDDHANTYRYYSGNPDWRNLSQEKHQRNEQHIDGYTRIFRDKKKKVFKYRG
jgi:hypothetical protein